MKIWYAIAFIGIVVNETQGVILTRIGVALFQNNFTTLAFKSCKKKIVSLTNTYVLSFKAFKEFCSRVQTKKHLPNGHPQIKLPGVSIHIPPLRQGFVSHSSTLISQVSPSQPVMRIQFTKIGNNFAFSEFFFSFEKRELLKIKKDFFLALLFTFLTCQFFDD